jgi:AAA domain
VATELELASEANPARTRFSRDEQAAAVWLSHTVILAGISAIFGIGIGSLPPSGFLIAEGFIWLMFAALVPAYDAPVAFLLRVLRRDEYLLADIEAMRHNVLPSAFVVAFVLQFVGLTPLLTDTGGPILSPFAAFVVVYAIFASLLTTRLWALGVTLLVATAYYTVMVGQYGSGVTGDRPVEGVYVAVTLLIIWLTVWLAFLLRLRDMRLRADIHAEADLATLRASVASQIWNRPVVHTRSLPARGAAARAALAEYHREHPGLALRLSPDGIRLRWEHPERMAAARDLTISFSPSAAADLLATSLALDDVQTVVTNGTSGEHVVIGGLPPDPVLPAKLLIRALDAPPSRALLESTVRAARTRITNASVAVLVVPDASAWLAQPASWAEQRTLATSIVILDAAHLLNIAGASAPRRALMTALREQADLTKANPFVLHGPTPTSMFYGRTEEETTVTALLATGSAALIGGRRTGKTSLIQRIHRTLRDEDWLVLYADLHAVGNWRQLAELMSVRWNVTAPLEFSPTALAKVLGQVEERRAGRHLVLLLDEVDQLLSWDQDHGAEHVPEAFFRSCRMLSQERVAQFVFSGERTIAERLWAPDSPHWNFCRPVMVQQLARQDTDRLLARPLEHLELRLTDRTRFLDAAWAHTSGHPQIVQQLGSELVHLLNERDPEQRDQLSIADLECIVERASFREHYASTYLGQATEFERLVCTLAAGGADTLRRLQNQLRYDDETSDVDVVRAALHMLALYGILDIDHDQLWFRAEWMPDALDVNVAGRRRRRQGGP